MKKEKWLCKTANYQELSGLKIPISDQPIWLLEDGDQLYNKFEVLKIKYIFQKRFNDSRLIVSNLTF